MILDEARVLIRTENMCKSYKLGSNIKEAVVDLDIRIMQGEFVIIEGLKGNEKKAFFNLLGCLEKPDKGKYFFDYEDIALAKPDMLDGIRKNKIGFLFRNFNLIGRLTAAENIEVPLFGLDLPKEEKCKRLQNSMKRFGIEGAASVKAGELSDFEKQLVSLARSVVNSPLMIIADDPAAHLDRSEEKLLMEHLHGLNRDGMTLVVFGERAAFETMGRCRMISFEAGRAAADKHTHVLSLVRREA